MTNFSLTLESPSETFGPTGDLKHTPYRSMSIDGRPSGGAVMTIVQRAGWDGTPDGAPDAKVKFYLDDDARAILASFLTTMTDREEVTRQIA